MSNTPEHDRQRRLTYLGIGTLLAAPFIGPFAFVAGGAIFAGKILRPVFNEEARKDYLNEKGKLRRNQNNRDYSMVSYEPVESALARGIPRSTSRLLENENERMEYTQGLATGASMVNEYLDGMSSEERDSIKEIIIYPESQKTFLGIPVGKKELEVIIKDDK